MLISLIYHTNLELHYFPTCFEPSFSVNHSPSSIHRYCAMYSLLLIILFLSIVSLNHPHISCNSKK